MSGTPILADLPRDAATLRACPPFDRLTDTELGLVAAHVTRRRFAPGALILADEAIAERIFVLAAGAVEIAVGAAPPPAPTLFDVASALFGLPVRGDYRAGAEGAEVLCLAKPHLFTLARECPDFIVGLAAEAERT
jgi:signal-transduction protein with cAMP-binding, CBS, and nucleotidyltransferase domain